MAYPNDQAPQSDAGVGAKISISYADPRYASRAGGSQEFGQFFNKVKFKGMANGGYIVKFTLFDAELALLPRLIQFDYFRNVRRTPVLVNFQIFRKPYRAPVAGVNNSDTRRKSTRIQAAIISNIRVRGHGTSNAHVEITAIDPPSWYLNNGDASGEAFTGNVSGAIRKTLGKYLPNLRYEVSPTRDVQTNKWYMMRQDPKTFITSMLEWSTSLTPQQTQWLIAMNGTPESGAPHIAIKEQAAFQSKPRGYYTFRPSGPGGQISTILGWDLISNNALSLAQTKIITHGVSALTGEYFDRTTDKAELDVYVKDSNTLNKRIANVDSWQSTARPRDGVSQQDFGATSVQSIPDVYSAGDLGLYYDQYITGRARGMYLGLLNNLLKMRVTVLGHGEWSDTFGLGIDTVFLNWTKEPADGENFYFMAGNWLIFGFEHRATRKDWYTDLWVARWDYNSQSVKVPSSTDPPNVGF